MNYGVLNLSHATLYLSSQAISTSVCQYPETTYCLYPQFLWSILSTVCLNQLYTYSSLPGLWSPFLFSTQMECSVGQAPAQVRMGSTLGHSPLLIRTSLGIWGLTDSATR